MATPKETIWALDPHTTAKHEILKRYLEAWFPILNTYNSRIVYIDGFSGPGRYKGGEVGSPVIALNVAVNHRKAMTGEVIFWFIEDREDRLERLRSELSTISTPPHFKVYTESGRFDEKFEQMMNSIEDRKGTLAPTFAFIDPFGFSGIQFSLIERLMKHPSCEVFLTFMVDSINRWLEHPDDKVLQHIVDTFGTSEALHIATSSGARVDGLRDLYQSQLQKVAKYVRYFEMRDRKDRAQYYLFFATNNERGHSKMKEAMWRADPNGEFRFSDATNPHQPVLFEVETSSLLVEQLRSKFVGRGKVTRAEVLKFVENETPFVQKHLTAALKAEEAAGRIEVDSTKSDGAKRRANTYPDGVNLTWR